MAFALDLNEVLEQQKGLCQPSACVVAYAGPGEAVGLASNAMRRLTATRVAAAMAQQ